MIYYILNSRWPTIKAYGLQVAKTCQGLVQAGVRVRLIIPRRVQYAEIAGADPFALYGIKDRFGVVRLPSLDVVRSKIFFNVQQVLFACVALVRLSLSTGTIYTRDPFTAYIASLFRASVFWEAHRFPANADAWLYRGLMERVTGIVVITRGLQKLFMEHGASESRVRVIHDAVDPEEFAMSRDGGRARAELGITGDRTIVGYVGQLTTLGEEKGVGTLLKACAQLKKDGTPVLVVIVGGSAPDIERHKSMAGQEGLGADDVLFAGHQPHERIPLWLGVIDIAVMPFPDTEHYAHFMSPLKMFEYMAAGKVIVTSDLPSIREVVSDDDVFFTVPGDAHALAACISGVLRSPEDARRKSVSALAHVQAHTWKARAQAILSFVSERVA